MLLTLLCSSRSSACIQMGLFSSGEEEEQMMNIQTEGEQQQQEECEYMCLCE